MTRWARGHDQCKECGTTERRHQGRGYCTTCYYRQYPRKKPSSGYDQGYDDGARDVALAIHALVEPAGGSCWLRNGHVYLQMSNETVKHRV